jgi:hypothetical protein
LLTWQSLNIATEDLANLLERRRFLDSIFFREYLKLLNLAIILSSLIEILLVGIIYIVRVDIIVQSLFTDPIKKM